MSEKGVLLETRFSVWNFPKYNRHYEKTNDATVSSYDKFDETFCITKTNSN